METKALFTTKRHPQKRFSNPKLSETIFKSLKCTKATPPQPHLYLTEQSF